MDLFPVDILPLVAGMMGMEYMRVVPSTDLNATFALSISVFLLIIFYSIKIKGVFGWLYIPRQQSDQNKDQFTRI
jgi:F-type H+-transporting ATPase subunit a